MHELVNRFITDAEKAAANGQHLEAGQYYEKAAGKEKRKAAGVLPGAGIQSERQLRQERMCWRCPTSKMPSE